MDDIDKVIAHNLEELTKATEDLRMATLALSPLLYASHALVRKDAIRAFREVMMGFAVGQVTKDEVVDAAVTFYDQLRRVEL